MSSVDPMPAGRPVSIVKQVKPKEEGGDSSFVLDGTNLEKILRDPKIRDKTVCVISVAGAFRKGKSFLLNFIIKYLEKLSTETHNVAGWLGDEGDKDLVGFKWRGGSERETTGIWVWSKVFLISKTTPGFIIDTTTTQIAVLLVDTQGTFDSKSSVKDCVTVFALGTMLSTTLVYNLSQNIQEDDLQHLQYFTEYGKLAMKENDEKPFQTLMFLVRDWQNPDEYGYGGVGGEKFLENKLENAGRHKNLEDVRKGIRECFSTQQCFLMPYPGTKVATSSKFTGKLADMDEEFKHHMKNFVESICSTNKLETKKISGKEITCGELLECFTCYVDAFKSDDLPSASTLVQVTAEVHHLAALEKIKSSFDAKVKEECGADKPYLTPDELEQRLDKLQKWAIEEFDKERKIGGGDIRKTYLEKLDTYLKGACEEYTKSNDNKANVLVWIACGVSYIAYPVTSARTFKRIQRYFIRGAVNVTSALRHPLDAIGRVADKIWNRMPSSPKPRGSSLIDGVMSAALSHAHAPIVLLLTIFIATFLSNSLSMIGLPQLAGYSYFVVLAAIVMLFVWLFSCFTGKARPMKMGIDAACDVVWNVFTADPPEQSPSETSPQMESPQTESPQTAPPHETSSPQTSSSQTTSPQTTSSQTSLRNRRKIWKNMVTKKRPTE